MTEPWLSTDEIAEHLGVAKDTVYAWIAEKGMPAHKIGRLWKCQASEVDEWVRTGAAASDLSSSIGVGSGSHASDGNRKEERR